MRVIIILFVVAFCVAAVKANTRDKNDDDKGKSDDEKDHRNNDNDEESEKNRKNNERHGKDEKKCKNKCKPKQKKNCKYNCPFLLRPVCGIPTNHCAKPKTFTNECELEYNNCKFRTKFTIFHQSACKEPLEPICNKICLLVDKPVCAEPGFGGESKTFENECKLDVYNCKNPKAQYKKVSDSACEPPRTSCSRYCPLYLEPFCALPDGGCGEPKTFTNPCYLGIYNCENHKNPYKFFHQGDCLKKPDTNSNCKAIACTEDYSPICGLPDGFCGKPMTFSNKCDMGVYNCFNPNGTYKYFHKGECIKQPDPQPICPQVCPLYVKSFCALPDGGCGEPKTFSNPCYLGIYNCENPNNPYKFFHDGDCLTKPDPEPNCAATSCTDDYTPICGLPDGSCGEPMTFSNGCNLEVYNCFNPDRKYKLFHDGECKKKPDPEPNCAAISCIADYTPFCGLPDGFCGKPMTFSNDCDMGVYNCFNPNGKYKYFHNGECIKQPDQSLNCSNIMCPAVYLPVCGLPDGFCGKPKTFSNACQMGVYSCQNPTEKYKSFHSGECIEKPDPEPICPQVCPLYVKSFCALPDGGCGEPKTFSNPCYLGIYNCENPNNPYKFFHDGACLTKPDPEPNCAGMACTDDYTPICGLPDGFCGKPMTFSNECDMGVYNCFHSNETYKYFHKGECIKQPDPKPSLCNSMVCPDIYSPVCTLPVNFCGKPKNMSNKCEIDLYNCNNPNTQYKYFHDGKCLEFSTPEPEPECNMVCLDNYKPICTLPENFCSKPKTFGNECSLNAYNCQNKDQKYKKFHDGKCLTDDPEPDPEPECITICPAIYRPVCALPDGFCGEPKTYSSGCSLGSYNCLHPDERYKYFHDGECIPKVPVCPSVCTDEYEPQCANGPSGDQKSWSNKCELKMHNCLNPNNQYTNAYDGECKECSNLMCNKIYQPVCATDFNDKLKTFGNRCELQSYNCDKNNINDQYTETYDGECKSACNNICTFDYKPVCGTDGSGNTKTFPYKCSLDSYICNHPDEGYSYSYEGGCKRKCITACADIYKPVCSVDSNGKEKVWGNHCELDSHNCQNPKDQYIWSYDGECKSNCSKGCPRIYSPVCGTDSNGKTKTFGNQCEFENYNCEHPKEQYTKSYDAECKPACNEICSASYEPVCASPSPNSKEKEAKTFSSQCALNAYNCLNPDLKYMKSSDGECTVNCKTLKCTNTKKWICATPNNSKGNPSSFYNDCERQLHNCNNPKNKYNYLHDGECSNES